jgi:hypothetical protein
MFDPITGQTLVATNPKEIKASYNRKVLKMQEFQDSLMGRENRTNGPISLVGQCVLDIFSFAPLSGAIAEDCQSDHHEDSHKDDHDCHLDYNYQEPNQSYELFEKGSD